LQKGNSIIFKGKEFNEIELLYQVNKKRNINKTVSRINLYKYSPSRFHLKEGSISEIEDMKKINEELFSVDS
jgi:hypothetical protein